MDEKSSKHKANKMGGSNKKEEKIGFFFSGTETIFWLQQRITFKLLTSKVARWRAAILQSSQRLAAPRVDPFSILIGSVCAFD